MRFAALAVAIVVSVLVTGTVMGAEIIEKLPKIVIPPGAIKVVNPPPGPASGVYQVYGEKWLKLGPNTHSSVRVVRLGLPKGNYVMEAKVRSSQASGTGDESRNVFCLITKDGGNSYFDRSDLKPGSVFDLDWTGSLDQPTVVEVKCGYDPGGDATASVHVEHLRALAVDKVTLTKD